MRTQHFLVMALAAATTITGCKKDENNGTPAPNPAANQYPMRGLFEQNLADATQTFNINAATGGQVMGTQGTILVFSPNAFLTAGGATVSGTVQVSLVEALSIADMIWLNKQTVGNDNGTLKLLRSGGELKLAATQGGNQLRVAPNGLNVMVPTSTGDGNMRLFSGSEDATGRMVWDPDTSTVVVVPDSFSTYYAFNADSLNWINCDYFYNYTNTTMLDATIPGGQPSDSTMVWIAFPTENAVMQMAHTTAQTYTTWQVVPVGMSAVVVGLYRNGTSYYSSFNTVSITSGMTVPMTFSPTTLAQFESDLDGI